MGKGMIHMRRESGGVFPTWNCEVFMTEIAPTGVGGVESILWGLLGEKEEPHGCLGNICC